MKTLTEINAAPQNYEVQYHYRKNLGPYASLPPVWPWLACVAALTLTLLAASSFSWNNTLISLSLLAYVLIFPSHELRISRIHQKRLGRRGTQRRALNKLAANLVFSEDVPAELVVIDLVTYSDFLREQVNPVLSGLFDSKPPPSVSEAFAYAALKRFVHEGLLIEADMQFLISDDYWSILFDDWELDACLLEDAEPIEPNLEPSHSLEGVFEGHTDQIRSDILV